MADTGAAHDGAAGAPAAARLQQRLAYAPWPFELDHVELRFDLAADTTTVASRLHLCRRADAAPDAPLRLMGAGLTLVRVVLDGTELTPDRYRLDDGNDGGDGGDGLVVPAVPDRFLLEVVTRVSPAANQSGKGLFVLGGTLVTQLEPEGLSRITCFPDRPDVLTRYRVTLVADASAFPVLLSNGNRVAQTTLPDGRIEVIWDDPFRKPSYIFALVAGRLDCRRGEHVTPSGRRVRLAVYAPTAFISRCEFALQALQRAMRWEETTYGLECDTDDYSMVALSGFPGAMENKGLNLFDLAGVIADPEISTDDEALTIERIIAHEYFHNWTGNRVTCRDWFQLSLKEGLTRFRDQCYTDELLGPGVYRIDSVRLLLRNQFPEDDGPARHAIRPESYAEVEQLYTATVYEKGAEVLRMLYALLGGPTFIRGVREYLRRFDGQAVTTDDFVDVMEATGGRDLTLFRRWYATAGRPWLAIERHHDAAARRLTLTMTQTVPVIGPDAPVLHIPVRTSLVGPTGNVAQRRLLELTRERQDFVFEDVEPGSVPSLLEGFSAPVTVAPFLSLGEQLQLLAGADDAYARWNAAQGVLIATVHDLAAAHHAGRPVVVPDALVQTFAALLAEGGGNRLLTAELLRIPDEPVLSEGRPEIDVDGHAAARTALRATLGRALKAPLLAAVQAPRASGDEALLNVAGMGRRRLAAVALDLLGAAGDDDIADLCLDRVRHGATMTERFDALSCLVDHPGPQRDAALAEFLERWRGYPTVVNKWFMVQALSRAPGAVDRIMALQSHPAFDIGNITMMMAYFGSFFRQNRVAFHDASGKGYEWLADCLLASDRLGRGGLPWLTPQIAQWRRHAPARRALMQAALQRLADAPATSNGLRGLVQRLLK